MSRDMDFEIPVVGGHIAGTLVLPNDACALVLFAHGSGSGRDSPRNQFVAEVLRHRGFGTLLLDLLTRHEQRDEQRQEEREEEREDRQLFDIGFLARGVIAAPDGVIGEGILPPPLAPPVGYFGASTGAAAALIA